MIKGFVAGNFDVWHYGYFHMFKACKEKCDKLIVALHIDPSVERPHKHKPIHSILERVEMLDSNKYVDHVFCYNIESDLITLLRLLEPNVRFLGDDYKGKGYTGDDLGIPIIYIPRTHGYSTTGFIERLKNEN